MKIEKRIILIAVAIALAVFAAGCNFSFTTAKIEDAIMTVSIDAEGKPGEEVVSYPADARAIYTSAKIMNAPDHTQIHIVWTYVTGKQLIDTITLDSGELANRYIYSDFTPSAILPEGDYQVEYYIDDREEPDATVKFVILSAAGASNTEYTLYSQAEGGFSFMYPTDWDIQEFLEERGAFVYPMEYAIANEDDINTVIVYAAEAEASEHTIDTLLQAWVDETETEALENYAYIAQAVDTINGKDIASYSYSWTRGDYQLYTVDALLMNGDNFYVLSFTATAEAYDVLYPHFEQMAISFEIL
ncbi:MAG: hypothetical protein Q8S22_00810 [Eubacteriales bacterium]|nr:hypothetical protein [Eubacteriales bacterium]